MTPTPEERLATLEADNKTNQNTLHELRTDVKALPATVAAQMRELSDQLTTAFRRETRRCRRIQQKRCPAAGAKQAATVPAKTWPETMKEIAVGLSIIGAILGSAYLGAQDVRALPAPAAQTQQQGGTK